MLYFWFLSWNMVYQTLVAVTCFHCPSMLTLSKNIHSNSFKCWVCISVVSSIMSSYKVWSWREKMIMVFCICHPRFQVLSGKMNRWHWLTSEGRYVFISCSCSSSKCLQIDCFRNRLGNLPVELCLLHLLIYHDFSQISIYIANIILVWFYVID